MIGDIVKLIDALRSEPLADPSDLSGMVEARRTLDRARAVLADVIAAIDADIQTALARQGLREAVVNGTKVTIRPGGWVGWDNDRLRHAVLSRARDMALAIDRENTAVNPDTGERVPTWDQAVRAIVDVWPLAGYQARAQALKALQLDPSEFAERGPDRLSIGEAR